MKRSTTASHCLHGTVFQSKSLQQTLIMLADGPRGVAIFPAHDSMFWNIVEALRWSVRFLALYWPSMVLETSRELERKIKTKCFRAVSVWAKISGYTLSETFFGGKSMCFNKLWIET